MADTTVLAVSNALRVEELSRPDSEWVGLLVLWDDQRVTVCWRHQSEEDAACCWTSAEPAMETYQFARALYCDDGAEGSFGFRSQVVHEAEG